MQIEVARYWLTFLALWLLLALPAFVIASWVTGVEWRGNDPVLVASPEAVAAVDPVAAR